MQKELCALVKVHYEIQRQVEALNKEFAAGAGSPTHLAARKEVEARLAQANLESYQALHAAFSAYTAAIQAEGHAILSRTTGNEAASAEIDALITRHKAVLEAVYMRVVGSLTTARAKVNADLAEVSAAEEEFLEERDKGLGLRLDELVKLFTKVEGDINALKLRIVAATAADVRVGVVGGKRKAHRCSLAL